jgi:hypothetical protein
MFQDKREQLIGELTGEKDYGVLLAAQMGGVPNELQLIVQTAVYDDEKEGLRPKHQYVIRALGVEEHQVHLGMFGTLKLHTATDHALLHQYNLPTVGFFFRGTVSKPHELALDIQQAHLSTYGFWRPVTDYLELTQPLLDLLTSGGGLLGRMPKPLGERMAKVFDHHQIEYKLIEADAQEMEDEHGRSRAMQALVIDKSYVVALAFSVDELGKV